LIWWKWRFKWGATSILARASLSELNSPSYDIEEQLPWKVKMYIWLTLLLLFIILPESIARAESKEFAVVNSNDFSQFEKSILKSFEGQTVYSLREIKTGKEITSVLGQKLVSPASVQKLITTYAALKELSGEFKFHTDFVFVEESLQLLIKGYGDPVMTDERLYKAADDLHRAGVRKITKIVLDHGAFIDPKKRTGINPYQAAQTAITLNFNTVNVRGQLVGDKKVFSKTSFSPLEFKPKVTLRNIPGVSFSEADGRVELSLNTTTKLVEDNYAIENPDAYFAEALIGVLKLCGIETPKNYSLLEIDSKLEPLVVSSSKDLASILADMNRYSSNFIAGQVTYQLGKEQEGKMSYERGLRTLSQFIQGQSRILDGSGLNRENRLTASGLSQLISSAMADQALAPDFQASLSKFGRRGTLRTRELSYPGEEKIWAKTGTIDGVSSIAGTMELKDKTLAAFVIITNGQISKSESTAREDFILRSFLAADFGSKH